MASVARVRRLCEPTEIVLWTLLSERCRAARELLVGLPSATNPEGGGDCEIDRALLEKLATDVTEKGSEAAPIHLWVATMMWGSGTTNGRGVGRTAQGLKHPELIGVLSMTSEAVLKGELATAHRKFDVKGTGEAFFTKWCWAVSLAKTQMALRPLILDVRVRATMAKVFASLSGGSAFTGSTSYVRYVETLHEAAAGLSEIFAHLDAEKLEWLLFDRPLRNAVFHKGTQEKCLHGWLP